MDDKDPTDSYDVTAEADQAHDDKWLADQVVALGVADWSGIWKGYLTMGSGQYQSLYEFVRDWRVAGALMERCQKIYAEYIGEPEQVVYARAENNRTWEWPSGESLPRTIIEACVEALS